MLSIPAISLLPESYVDALLVGRVWRTGAINGPCVVVVRQGEVIDITRLAMTVSDLFEREDLLPFLRTVDGESLGNVHTLLQNATNNIPESNLKLLAPCDLQAIKACGVTFAVSLLERVIEEQAGGDAAQASGFDRFSPAGGSAFGLRVRLVLFCESVALSIRVGQRR